MDMQTYFDNTVTVHRQERLKTSDQLTLGEMILKLEPIAEKQKNRIKEDDPEAVVQYDFEYLFPTSINSWRGSYDELALNFESEGDNMKVSDFLKILKDMVGKILTGYKGGDYLMGKNTPVWVANYGNSGSTAVIDIIDNGYEVIIMTGYREY